MEKYIGTFKLEKNENFDDFLQKAGLNWMLRKLIIASGLQRTITKNDDGTYTFKKSSGTTTILWENVKLNEWFKGKDFDGQEHEIRFELDGDVLIEKHKRPGNEHIEITRHVIDGDHWIMEMNNGVAAKRILKKIK